MKGSPSAWLSAGAVACLTAGFILVFFTAVTWKILILAGLILWGASFWLNRGAVKSDFSQRLASRKEMAFLDEVERELTEGAASVVARSFCGVDLETPLSDLEANPDWAEVDPETFDLFRARIKPGERLFGHRRINLMAGVLDSKIYRISLFLARTESVSGLVARIHGHFGTKFEEKEEWTVWEDERTRLELLSREEGAHLSLMEKEDDTGDEVL